MGWLSGWDKRIELTIDKDLIDTAPQVNFPVMVYLSASSGIGSDDVSAVFDELTNNANRKKIAVTSSDGTTELYVEIERWDDANEKAWLHVKVPSVAHDADTILYLYYDSTKDDNDAYVGDTTDAVTHNVWDEWFKGVWHMAQDPNGDGADAIKDSTSNHNDATPDGTMLTEDLVEGKVGKAIAFEGIDDHLDCGDDGSLDITGDMTVEFVVHPASATAYMRIGAKAETSVSTYQWSLTTGDAGTSIQMMATNGATTFAGEVNGLVTTSFQYVVGTFVVSTGELQAFLNATAGTLDTLTGTKSTCVTGTAIACRYLGAPQNFFNGIIDEVRISSSVRSDAWIKATYHSLWDSLITFGGGTVSPILIEDATIDDAISGETVFNPAALTEGVSIADEMTIESDFPDQGVSIDDAISPETNYTTPALTEAVTIADEISAGLAFEAPLTEAATIDDTIAGEAVLDAPLTEGVTIDDLTEAAIVITIEETLQFLDNALPGWAFSIAESLKLTDVAETELQLIIQEFLELTETLASKWVGVETISDVLQLFEFAVAIEVFYDTVSETLKLTDTPSAIHRMIEAVADSLGIAEAVTGHMTFNPALIEAMNVVAAVSVFNTLNLTNAETLELTDTVQPGWLVSISETLGLTETSTLAWAAMLTLTENLAFTESVLVRFDIDETVAETLGLSVALSMQAVLQAIVTEVLEFGITITLDDEQWECWVLNSNSFNASIYSGYGFNSFCVYNGVAYGAKSTGVYELTGTTDDGSPFKAGMVLPDTRFGSSHQKRFRKAFFGLSGGVTPSIRMETESGSQTYTITKSKANISRNLKGRAWTIKVQDFDSLDFMELFPVILTR